jgi:transposase
MQPVSCASCQALQRRLRDLQAENDRLRRQLDEATRAAKRQAAPFAKGQPAGPPKKPGRKPGKDHGTKAHRQPPFPEQIDEVHEAPLPEVCPDCGSLLDETHVAQQFQVEIPRLRRADEMAAAATRGAVRFPRRVAELLRAGLDLRDRHAAGEISRHGLAVARGRLENQPSDLIFPPKTNAANERLAQHLWAHRDDLFTFLRQPGLDATNWRAELAIRFGVILRKVWGGSRTWAGARAQSVLMSVWPTCWQQGRSAMNFLSQLLRGPPSQGRATRGIHVRPADAAVAL